MPRECKAGIAQQIDIMPTILGYLGYNRPYVAFGIDLLNTPSEDTWAVTNNNGIYQYVKGDYVIHFDGTSTKAAYNYKKDRLLEHNLISDPSLRPTFQSMERTLKAIIQSYMQRMTTNNLVVN
jgi:phosphoglycerol transferase MdoB-like AlkP superfamily enzyme